MGDGLGQRACGHAARRGADRRAYPVECREAELEAFALLVQATRSGNARFLERDLPERMRRGKHEGPDEAQAGCIGGGHAEGEAPLSPWFLRGGGGGVEKNGGGGRGKRFRAGGGAG